MFQQAKVLEHEYLPEGDGHSVARGSRFPIRPTGLPDVQAVSMDVSPDDVYRCRENLVTREIVGETILVPISGELADLQQVFSLNPTGAFIWQHLDGDTPLAAIQEAVVASFKVRKREAWTDLSALIVELADAGLIERVE